MGPINCTVVVDGIVGPIQVVSPSQPAGSPAKYNMLLFDLQLLPFGMHTLAITSTANFIFDYASVNQTNDPPHHHHHHPA
jgi:hypothetical protein